MELINAIYRVKFNRIAAIASRLAGEAATEFDREIKRQEEIIRKNFIRADGRCSIEEQTAVAMLIYHDIHVSDALKEQLSELVREKGFHHSCGMVGLRHLYMALNKCGMQEYAYKIITASGYPSYRNWIENGADTLWEMWDGRESKNHHMYSDVLSWMMKTIVGISPDDNAKSFDRIEVKPYFFRQLDNASGMYETPKGKLEVSWKRENKKVILTINVPAKGYVCYNSKLLDIGITSFETEEEETE